MDALLKFAAGAAKPVAAVSCGLALCGYGLSYLWPIYDWDLRAPSPDAKYDLVVLRENLAAFSPFCYRMYLFPHESTPQEREKGERVWLTPIWRGDKYLVYSGCYYPSFRWTGPRSIVIDLHEAYYTGVTIDPVKIFTSPAEPVVISVIFGREDATDINP